MSEVQSHLKIGNRIVGTGQPIFLMADIGLTHDGQLDKALRLIDIAGEAGADAVKIQTVDSNLLMPDRTASYSYQTPEGQKTETLYQIFCDLWFEEAEVAQIAERVRSHGMEFIATADYENEVDMLERVGVNCHKIDTWSVGHKRLIQKMGRTRKPMMLDTGMNTVASLGELIDVHAMAGGRGVVILHDFRTKDPSEMNFRNIPYLKRHFGFPIGFTPQGRESNFDYMSVGLGADVLEKRLTLDRRTPRNGHGKALEPEEFKAWVSEIRMLEASLGQPGMLAPVVDIEQGNRFLKSLYVQKELKPGDLLEDGMIEARRPGTGVSAMKVDDFVGRRARRLIKAGTMLNPSDFE